MNRVQKALEASRVYLVTSANLVTLVPMVWMVLMAPWEARALPDSPVPLETRVLQVHQVLKATPVHLGLMALPAKTENLDLVGRMEKWVHPVNRVNRDLSVLVEFVVNAVLQVTRVSMVSLVMMALLDHRALV